MKQIHDGRRFLLFAGALAALAAATLTFLQRLSPVPVVTAPAFVSAAQADWLGGGELVLGVIQGGIAKAYPIGAVAPLEYLNDEVGGHPIGVSW